MDEGNLLSDKQTNCGDLFHCQTRISLKSYPKLKSFLIEGRFNTSDTQAKQQQYIQNNFTLYTFEGLKFEKRLSLTFSLKPHQIECYDFNATVHVI